MTPLRSDAVKTWALALLMLGSVVPACGASTGPSSLEPASLSIQIDGVPDGTPASVSVRGPGGFIRSVTATTVLQQLAPGSYTILAFSVSPDGGGTVFSPSPTTQTIDVAPGATAAAQVSYSTFRIGIDTIVTGLTSPVFLTAPAGDPRLFIVEQPGRIRIYKEGALLATPFLDISSRVMFQGEQGLLSLAFDPDYASNGHFYVYFTNRSGDNTVERFTATPTADVADPTPADVLTIPHQPYSNHNGGLIMFGPDGMLYIGTGDGGSGGDPQGNGQNLNTLLGKLLRIDVSSLPYTIPSTNPFAGQPNRRGEIWAFGLRNPWRWDFGAAGPSGSPEDLFIADVGQNAFEEVNFAAGNPAGLNYGWNIMEGAHCYGATTCNTAGLTLPVYEYGRTDGCSVTGGFVYRGSAIPEVAGQYFFSDWCEGWLSSLTREPGGFRYRRWEIPGVGNVMSFGEDSAGELYMLVASGRVFRLVRQ